MTTLRDEMMASYYLYESGASLEIARDEQGGVRLQRVPDPAAEAAALGPGAYRDPYAISEAAGAPVSEQEVAGTMGGVVPGAAIGAATGIQDIGALAYGGIKAATAEEGQRIDEFLKGFQAISGVIGSEKAFELYNAGVDALPISDEAKQGLRQGAMVGEVIGFGGAAGEAGKGVAKGVQTYAAGAPQRIADRTSGATLGMGADPTAMVDEAIVAGQKLMGNVDEARAAYEASPNDPALRQQYLDLRRQRDAQLSQLSPSEQLEFDVSYRMDHQPRGPQDGGGRLDDITAGGELFPEDVYSTDGLRIYGNPNNVSDRQSYAAIMEARGNPDAEITIYRAVPQNVDQINPGDWVTLSPEYAAVHAGSGYGPDGQQAGKVISQRVRVKDVYSDGNDLNEFGFFPSELADASIKKIVPPTETEPGIIAFHGSGADFDQFSLEKIGTGEGAQAYGYGLYFTDSEDIAKFYKDMMARNVDIDGRPYIRGNQINDNLVDEDIADDLAATNGDLEAAIKSSEEFLQEMIAEDNVNAIRSTSKELEKLKALRGRVTVGAETGKTYKVALSPKPDEFLDYDLPIGEQPEEIKVALIKALEDINDPELNANITLEARAAKEKQEAVVSLNKELDDFSDSLPNQKSKETFAKLRELLIDKKHKWSAMVNKADMEEERKLFEEFTKAVPPSKYPDIDPNIVYDIQRSLKIASPKSIGSFLPTDKKTADALSNAGIKGIKYRAAGSRRADVDDAATERNYVIFDDKAIKILEKYGIVGPVAVTAIAGAQQQEGDDNGA